MLNFVLTSLSDLKQSNSNTERWPILLSLYAKRSKERPNRTFLLMIKIMVTYKRNNKHIRTKIVQD